jgi:hypothetical protein
MPKKWTAALIGLGVAVFAFLILRAVGEDFYSALREGDNARVFLIWVTLLGIGVGGAALAAVRYHPLVAAVPAVVLLALNLPVFINLWVPSWYPEWVRSGVLVSLSPVPFTIIGVLGVASLWALWDRGSD